MAWWIEFVFPIQVSSCCVYEKRAKKNQKKMWRHLCTFDCIISKKIVCLCMLFLCNRAGTRIAILTHPYLVLRWLFRLYIYKLKYINLIFLHFCAICCVHYCFVWSCHNMVFWGESNVTPAICVVTARQSVDILLYITFSRRKIKLKNNSAGTEL